jgi:hypothetical protein
VYSKKSTNGIKSKNCSLGGDFARLIVSPSYMRPIQKVGVPDCATYLVGNSYARRRLLAPKGNCRPTRALWADFVYAQSQPIFCTLAADPQQ